MTKARQYLTAWAIAIAWVYFGSVGHAQTVTFSIGMAYVDGTASGDPVSTSCLFQLINLGPDGVFDPIPAGSWVGGENTVIAQYFVNSDGWTSAAAFDLTDGTGSPGVFSRQFTFTLSSLVYPGEEIGIRWFPTVNASDYATTTTVAGMPYGEFTRQSAPLYGGTLWVVPSAGSLVTFDPLITSAYDPTDGEDPESSAMADYFVIGVPEPRMEGLFVLGMVIAILYSKKCGKRLPDERKRRAETHDERAM